MSKYADVFKGAKDLLSKSFNYTEKVEVKTAAPNGVVLTAEVGLSKPTSASLKIEGSKDGLKLEKLSLATDKKLALEFSLDKAFPGTKLSFKGSDASRAAGADAITAVIGVEHSADFGNFTLDVDALNYGVDATALLALGDGVLVGASGKATVLPAFDVRDYNVLLGYRAKGLTLAVQTDKRLSGVTAFYHQAIAPNMATAAVAKFPLAAKAASAFDIEVGLSYAPSSDVTVVGKANSSGKVAGSYAAQLNSSAKLTLAAEVDAANIASDDHKVGIALAISV